MAKTKADVFFNLPKNWEEIIGEIFENGGTDVEAHLSLGVNALDHKQLLTIASYSDAFENGMAVSEAWWMKWARDTLTDETTVKTMDDGTVVEVKPKKIDTKLFEIFMKRMFAWDKKLDKKKEDEVEKTEPKKEADKFAKKYGIKAVK